jgi:hypothetical protein
VLFLSAIAAAPWSGLTPVAVSWGLLGLFGIAYSVIVARRLRTQTSYKPVGEDWLLHSCVRLRATQVLNGPVLAIRQAQAKINHRSTES